MAVRLHGETLRWLEALNRDGSFARMGDGPLLERYLARPGASGELAFETLVRRHGPMVLSLCRGVLRDEQAADDAFQATFLVLSRRASNIRDHDRLGPWLGRVARRIALRSRAEAARRTQIEQRASIDGLKEAPVADHASSEAASLVLAEVDRLPDSDRVLVQLTYWQGKTYEEAAALLRWPIGTVRSRLSRVRDRLRSRLERLGLAPSVAFAAKGRAVEGASMAGPAEALVLRTVRAAPRHSGEITAAVEAGMVPASVAALVNGELAMMATPWKSIGVLFLLGGSVTAGMATLAVREGAGPAVAQAPAGPKAKPESQAKAEVKSILANGGVEEGKDESPRVWTEGAEVPGVEYLWSHSGHEGKASLCLKKTAKRYFPIAQWTQKVDRKGDSPRLKVSAWVKAEKATKGILDAQFLDSKGEWTHAWVAYIGPKDPDKPPVTHDWKLYEGVVAIPPDTKQIIIAPQIYGPGTLWFDDLAAEYTDDPATDPLGK
jgi:RNA polymerase sigma factor (sigma-70 family)